MGLLSKYIKLIFKRFNGETVEEYVENVPTVPGALSELNVKLGGNENDIKATDTKVHALGRIYKTLGGTDDTSRIYTTAQMIRKITEVAERGGGGGEDCPFSAVTVKVTAGNVTSVKIYAPMLIQRDGEWEFTGVTRVAGNTSQDIQFILWNGVAYGDANALVDPPSLIGGVRVVYDTPYQFMVTGAGEMTLYGAV